MVAPGGQAHLVEQGRGGGAHILIDAAARRKQGHHDVLERGKCRQQVVVLKDKADGASAQARERPVGKCASVLSEQVQRPRCRMIEQPYHVEQGAFPTAGRTDQRGELARTQHQINAMQHFSLDQGAHAVRLSHTVQPQRVGRGNRALPLKLIRLSHEWPPRGPDARPGAPAPPPTKYQPALRPPWPPQTARAGFQ